MQMPGFASSFPAALNGKLDTRQIRFALRTAAQRTRTWAMRYIFGGRETQADLKAQGHPHSRIRPLKKPLPINDRLGRLRQRTRIRESRKGITLSFPDHIVLRRHTSNSRMQNRPWLDAVMDYIDRVLKL